MRDLLLSFLVALALFLAGFSAGRMAQPELELQVNAELAKDADLESLRAQVARLEWELKQATEDCRTTLTPPLPNPGVGFVQPHPSRLTPATRWNPERISQVFDAVAEELAGVVGKILYPVLFVRTIRPCHALAVNLLWSPLGGMLALAPFALVQGLAVFLALGDKFAVGH